MERQARHDAWAAAENYERYMGRWSRAVAAGFLDWLAPPAEADWLDVGCGTGALSAAILKAAAPRSLVAVEPARGFRARAEEALADPRAQVLAGEAEALPVTPGSADVAVSALVLNFVPDRAEALAEARRALRPGGRLGFYVWDYPGGGMEMLAAFWEAARTLDPHAADLDEARRFAFCTPDALVALARGAGFRGLEAAPIEVPTRFASFEDFWDPFTLGTGPAPGYCASLATETREALRDRLDTELPRDADGGIELRARAWAVKGTT